MHPIEAVKICLIDKYVTFRGRASRAEFWWFFLFIVSVNLTIAHFFLFLSQWISGPISITIAILVNLAFSPALFAVTIRRFHDMNRSGFWCFGILLIDIMALALSWDIRPPLSIHVLLYVFLGLFLLRISIFFWLSRSGTSGANRFGLPDLPYSWNDRDKL